MIHLMLPPYFRPRPIRYRLAGQPAPTPARQTMISRSQQSLVKVALTVWPESHEISKPSEHQRISL